MRISPRAPQLATSAVGITNRIYQKCMMRQNNSEVAPKWGINWLKESSDRPALINKGRQMRGLQENMDFNSVYSATGIYSSTCI